MYDAPMTLGELIDYVSDKPGNSDVRFSGPHYDGLSPDSFGSWRGNYSCLALFPHGKPITASHFVEGLRKINGVIFSGHHGGEFQMGLETPIFVTPDDSACGPRDENGQEWVVGIMGINDTDGTLSLILERLGKF